MHKTKKYALICLIFILFCSTLLTPNVAEAKADTVNVLVINSTAKDELNLMKLSLGHFSKNITTVSNNETLPDMKDFSHVIYIGSNKSKPTAKVRNYINEFHGPTLVLFEEAEYFYPRYNFLEAKEKLVVSELKNPQNGEVWSLNKNLLMNYHTEVTPSTEVLISGLEETGKNVPVFVKKHSSFYGAIETLYTPVSPFFTEVLFEFFNVKPNKKQMKYLRLEDVSPDDNPKTLKKVGKFLKENDVPYLVTLIPVFYNPKTNETIHLSDNPELIKTLRYMQKNGAAFILHGYTHQYRDSETGEGFEFWDVKNNRPIYQKKEDPILTRKDFSTEEEYKKHQKRERQFEETYIKERIEKGVNELVTHGIYPLGFEAPHYTMSQKGYEILSKHFSTYVGQIQLTDDNWESMSSPHVESYPDFLHGMKLLPETLGFVSSTEPKKSLSEMEDAIEHLQSFSNSYYAVFYHPYLVEQHGLKYLKQLINTMNSIPNTTWLDLKKETNTVKTENVTITSENGEIHVEKPWITSTYELKYFLKEKLIWILFFIGLGWLITYSVFFYKPKSHKDAA